MHELSLVMEVIDLVSKEAGKSKILSILELEIEVGYLSGVDADAFQSALEMMVQGTLLENSRLAIIRTPATGRCKPCDLEFTMQERLAVCPACQAFPSEISGGQEFRVLSLLVE